MGNRFLGGTFCSRNHGGCKSTSRFLKTPKEIPQVHSISMRIPIPAQSSLTIAHLEFQRATHRAANLLRRDGEDLDGKVVAIIAQSDTVLYHATLVGIMTRKLCCAGLQSLLRASSCHRILATRATLAPLLAGLEKQVAEVDPEFALSIEEISSLSDIYPHLGVETPDCQFQPYSSAGPRPSLDDVGLYLHSSGSTGYPKAIAQTNRALEQWSQLLHQDIDLAPVAEVRVHTEQPIANMGLPSFHPLGIVCQPLSGTPVAVYTPTATSPSSFPIFPSPGGVLEHARKTKCRSLTSARPSRDMFWAGGPLPQRIGDALVDTGVGLLSIYGTTETGPISTVFRREEDAKEWAWFGISGLMKPRWVSQGDGTFECQLLNSVAGTVMFGSERPQTGILIETTPSLKIDVRNAIELAELRNKIWPIIEEANKNSPAFSRIFKEMILFTSSDKPLPRSGKGTVQRKAAITLYATEIESIYKTVEEQISAIDTIEPPVVWEVNLIHDWILELAGNVCNSAIMSSKVDLKQQGFDSLTATVFRLHIVKALRSHQNSVLARAVDAIPQNLAYAYPTISQLASFLASLVGGLTDTVNREIDMEHSVATNASSPLPESEESIVEICSGPGIPLIVFPGATGRLGPLLALRAHFTGTLWGAQVTKATPAPLASHAQFIVEKLLQKQPHGPYRLAAYSGSTVLGIAVAKLLEGRGEQVAQLSFIDHFPLLWTTEEHELLVREQLSVLVDRTVQYIIDMLYQEPLYGPGSEQIAQLEAALAGSSNAEKSAVVIIEGTRRMTPPLCEFLADFCPPNVERTYSTFAEPFILWVSSVQAPFSLLIAEFGIKITVPETSRRSWADLGAHLCHKSVEQRFITGVGHYGILGDKRTAKFLERWGHSQ
ncbi:hypothetical protein B0H14DRAFT_3140666 [Mycena olivaceomarginata]|nr:hypothetical protein B0H14DRAFT_3140666 [Mycena olivaceomarginata]